MGFFDSLKKMLQGPPHVQVGDDEGAMALHEEYHVANAGDREMQDIDEHSQSAEFDAPVAAAPFAGEGEIRAAELEAEIIRPEDVTPDDTVESKEEPIPPSS
jgi:hypothetical protein